MPTVHEVVTNLVAAAKINPNPRTAIVNLILSISHEIATAHNQEAEIALCQELRVSAEVIADAVLANVPVLIVPAPAPMAPYPAPLPIAPVEKAPAPFSRKLGRKG